MIWASFCIWGAWLVKKIQAYLAVKGIKELISENQLDAIYVVLLTFAAFSFLIYTVIALKKKTAHVTLGTCVLILVVIIAGLNYNIAKSSYDIKRSFTKNCVYELDEFPENDLSHFGCNKYVRTDNELDTTCKDSDELRKYFKFNWEQSVKEEKEFYNSSLENSCLNGNCCRQVGYFYAYYPYTLYFVMVNLTFYGLLISYISFHLSHKEKSQADGKKGSFTFADGFFLFMLLGLLIGACVVLHQTSTTLPDYRRNHVSPNPPPPPEP